MRSRILKNTMISCVIAVILSVFTCVFVFSTNLQDTMNQQAYSQTMLLVHILETSKDAPVDTLEKIKNEIYGRITFVDENGVVVYDSDYDIAGLASHADRREIIEARENGVAINQRMSDTANRITYYCAARVADMGVIRVGVMSASLATDVIIGTSPVIWLCIIGFILAIMLFSSATTKRIVNTIEKYDIENGEGEIYTELSPFITKIKSQNDIIKQQVQTLTDEKLKLQSIFMNIKEGIVVCDSRGKIIQTNKEAVDIFDMSEDVQDIAGAIQPLELHQAVEKAIKGEIVHSIFALGGRWYQSVTSPNLYAGDRGAILIVLDITQQVESENSRRRFTDNVTHELKTPLTSILGYSQLITNDIARPDDIKGFVEIIETNAQTLMEMINDVIKISDLETGEGFNKTPLQLDEIVTTAASLEKTSAQRNDITINTKIEKVNITADESQMYQLVHNLISNAIKYNREKGRVDVSLYSENGFAVLTVQDTGIGISKEHQDKIFERFYVVDKARNKKISSTGLGLSIVKHVVKAHNGTVDINSVLGQGTKFTIKLPLE